MDLLQVIIPKSEQFFILLDNKEYVSIRSYEKIEIDFCSRIVVENGESRSVRSPMITYRVDIDKPNMEKLKKLFSDAHYDAFKTIHNRESKIQVGEHGYVFPVTISARPDMNYHGYPSVDYKNMITITLKLENTKISLFDEAECAYQEISSRFELMDL